MTVTALQRLLKHPHAAVFDKEPGAELALRVRHANGAAWSLADETLTVSAGDLRRDYDLSAYTIGSLVTALRADGFDVPLVSDPWSGISALVLVEGSGDQGVSNGDHLHAFTSLLWVLLTGYAAEVRDAEYAVEQALRQMIITQAEGEWLDLWGQLYATQRLADETDADYAPRIPREAFRVRVNGFAIEQAVKDATGHSIEIREPWRLMFRLDESRLSGLHHFHDASYYTPHIIHPVAREPIDWSGAFEVIERNRAAGVLVYSPSIEQPTHHVIADPQIPCAVVRSIESLRVIGAWQGGERPLGVMRLDDNEITLNHPMMAYQLRTYGSDDGLQTEQVFGRARNVAYASIALSDGVRLGDENAILSRGQLLIELTPSPTVSSELAMSGYRSEFVFRRVERITLRESGTWLSEVMPEAAAATSREDTRAASVNFYDGTNTWIGPWDSRKWLGWRFVGSVMTSSSS